MKRLTVWATALLLIAATVFSYVPAAHACSIDEAFVVTADHLADPNFNAADSQMNQAYREWVGDPAGAIEVLGVYVFETIYSLDPDGGWSRGSVGAPVEMWGQWPENPRPSATLPEDRSGDPFDDCGWGATGRPLGTRDYRLVTTGDFASIDIADQDQDVLEVAFGAPAIADRDLSREQDLIAQVNSARTSSTLLFVGVGLAALAAAGAVMYKARRGGTSAQSDEI